jgi:hypothetical protein
MKIYAIEAEAKLLAEENRIIFTELSHVDPEQRTWVKKKQSIIRQRHI